MPAKERLDTSLFMSEKECTEMEGIFEQGKEAQLNPIGTFQLNIAGAVLERAQSSDRLQIHYELVILAGKYEGEIINKYDGLGSPKQAAITQLQLAAVGIETEKLNLKTLPAALLQLLNRHVTAKAKQNGPYYNITFQKLITGTPQSVPARSPNPRSRSTEKPSQQSQSSEPARPATRSRKRAF